MRWMLLAIVLVGCTRNDAPPRSDSLPPVDSSGEPEAVPDIKPRDTLITPSDSMTRQTHWKPVSNAIVSLASYTATSAAGGIPAGLNKWPVEKWCQGPMTGTVASLPPKLSGGIVRKAAYCQFHILGAIPRKYMTSNGRSEGSFSLSRGKQACDDLARELTPAVVRDDGQWLIAVMLIDEPNSPSWSGPVVKASVIAEYTRYCKAKLPGVRMHVRLHPADPWVSTVPASSWGVDLWHAQWRTVRGPRNLSGVAKQKAWYDEQLVAARRLGDGVVLGLNARDCDRANSGNYCTPSQVRDYAKTALDSPGNCFFPAWWYEDRMWNNHEYRSAWGDVINYALTKPATDCGQGVSP